MSSADPGAIVLAVVVGAVAVLLVWALLSVGTRLRESRTGRELSEAAVTLLQREIEAAREDARRAQDTTLASVRHEMTQFGGQMNQQLGQVQLAVTSQLQQVTAEVNRRLQESLTLVQETQTAVGERLDQAAKTVGEVHGRLGTLTEAARRIEALGRDISGLEQILRAPKTRGTLGEILLERLLAEILPSGSYRLQHVFKSGERVDAAIGVAGRLVPVDSKFPLENFRRLLEEPDEERRRPFRRAFLRDVRTRAEEIARKYIVPDEGTFDFALMYIPAESVYYEITVRNGDEAEDAPLTYALSRRVIPVSPNSFYAYLQVILLGLKGLRIEQNARDILTMLGGLSGDLGRFREHFDTLGRHVTNAKNKHDEAAALLARLEVKLENIEGRGETPALPEAERRSSG